MNKLLPVTRREQSPLSAIPATTALNSLFRILPEQSALLRLDLSPRAAIRLGIEELSADAKGIHTRCLEAADQSIQFELLSHLRIVLAGIIELRRCDSATLEQHRAYRTLCAYNCSFADLTLAYNTLRGTSDPDHIEALFHHATEIGDHKNPFNINPAPSILQTLKPDRFASRLVRMLTPQVTDITASFVTESLGYYRDHQYESALVDCILVGGRSIDHALRFASVLAYGCEVQTAEKLLQFGLPSNDRITKLAAAAAIRKHFPREAAASLVDIFRSSDDLLRVYALRFLCIIKDPSTLQVAHRVISALTLPGLSNAISEWPEPSIVRSLVNTVLSTIESLLRRQAAANILESFGGAELSLALSEPAAHPNARFKVYQGQTILTRLHDEGLFSRNPDTCLLALQALNKVHDESTLQAVLRLLKRGGLDEDQQLYALNILAHSNSPQSFQALFDLSQTTTSHALRGAALHSAIRCGGGSISLLLKDFENLPIDEPITDHLLYIAARQTGRDELRSLITLYKIRQRDFGIDSAETLSILVGTRDPEILTMLTSLRESLCDEGKVRPDHTRSAEIIDIALRVGRNPESKSSYKEIIMRSGNVPFRIQAMRALHGKLWWRDACELYARIDSCIPEVRQELAALLLTLNEPAINARLLRDGLIAAPN